MKGMEVWTCSTTQEDFRPQKANTKRGSTSGETWQVDVGKEWLSTQHQATGKQVANDPLERNATRNTTRPWWVALEIKELLDCLKKLDRGVSSKGVHCKGVSVLGSALYAGETIDNSIIVIDFVFFIVTMRI